MHVSIVTFNTPLNVIWGARNSGGAIRSPSDGSDQAAGLALQRYKGQNDLGV